MPLRVHVRACAVHASQMKLTATSDERKMPRHDLVRIARSDTTRRRAVQDLPALRDRVLREQAVLPPQLLQVTPDALARAILVAKHVMANQNMTSTNYLMHMEGRAYRFEHRDWLAALTLAASCAKPLVLAHFHDNLQKAKRESEEDGRPLLFAFDGV